MRVVIQRVSKASVKIEDNIKSKIGKGMLILLGIEAADTHDDIDWLCGKISRLRIFDDENGIMNLAITDIKGEIIIVSQFTLHASTKKGNRPSYIRAAAPDIAIPLYEDFIKTLKDQSSVEIKTGEFGAMMDVELVNNGPVTIMIDSKNRE
ncbi:MAG TPA: D-aminoacyl-tRNA deacylase [Bacteroidales bacterium]|nr:D-aminoacyl-tRNA deacylase [Bacteroidales bacterium]HRX96163.1 D-aminoacyl-tRNA deacylase [Bacteroidales bacterium]